MIRNTTVNIRILCILGIVHYYVLGGSTSEEIETPIFSPSNRTKILAFWRSQSNEAQVIMSARLLNKFTSHRS
jgi:hypothetical protein